MERLYPTYQYAIYLILHYCSFWTILVCIISAVISWRLFQMLRKQNTNTDDAYLAWWSTAIWGGAAIIFFLIGLFY